MAQVGIVKTLEGGVFYAKDSSGNIRELSIGDSISENEVVYGDSSNQISAKVEMELSGNDIIVLNQAQQQLIDSSLNQVTFGNEEVIFTKGDIVLLSKISAFFALASTGSILFFLATSLLTPAEYSNSKASIF